MQNYHSVVHFDGYKTKVYGRNLISGTNLKQTSSTICEYINRLQQVTLYIHNLGLGIWNITVSIKGKVF
jgi:hypothetical protein